MAGYCDTAFDTAIPVREREVAVQGEESLTNNYSKTNKEENKNRKFPK